MSTFGGIDPTLRYYEFETDSFAASTPFTQAYAKENWPAFAIGGKKPLTSIAAIKILEVQIPFSWYVFNARNNTFILLEGVTPFTITIPVGNYTSTSLATLLGTLLTAAGGSYNVTYSDVTQKFSFYNQVAASTPFSFQFGVDTNDDGLTNPRRYLGFPGGVTVSQDFIPGGPGASKGNVLTCPFAVNISGPNYLYVNSQAVGVLADIYLPQVSGGGGNSGPQLAKVPVNQNSGGVISWADPDPQKWYNLEGLDYLVDIDFFLTLGTDPAVLDLNGQGFSVKLGVLERITSTTFDSGGTVENRAVKRIRNF